MQQRLGGFSTELNMKIIQQRLRHFTFFITQSDEIGTQRMARIGPHHRHVSRDIWCARQRWRDDQVGAGYINVVNCCARCSCAAIAHGAILSGWLIGNRDNVGAICRNRCREWECAVGANAQRVSAIVG